MPAPPKLKSRYEIKDRLPKQGAMGVVYRAFDVELRRMVAIKTIGDAHNRVALDHFRQEWEILAKINHANIVDIYDIGEMEDEGQLKPFFVMPFLNGSTLEQLIASNSLTVERTVEIVCQVCRGLQAAHDQGVIHRDLKPSNIFVIDDAGSVKIIDFGIAHLTDNTQSVGVKGTPLYMSPEQFRFNAVGPQSDVFSLGVVCYEAFTGRRPFQGDTTGEIAHRIAHVVPPQASALNPAVDTVLGQVLHVSMAKEVRHRFQSAREFSDALQRALHGKPIERFDASRVAPRIQRVQRLLGASQFELAAEVLTDLEAEGHLQTEIGRLRREVDHAVKERRIQHTLDSARQCVEEEEYELARQKVQQVLDTSPGHADAQSIMAVIEEKYISQRVAEWMRLAREHLDNQSFDQARQAIRAVLSFRAADTEALQLLNEVARVEEHIARMRREAAELFQNARDAFERGDVSLALSKAEKVLDLDKLAPDKSSPDLAAAHQHFYSQVQSEHLAIHSALDEIRRLVAAKDFRAADELCGRMLVRYPRDAQFRALRIDIDQKERQHLSAVIARIDREIEAEPDLDRRMEILRQAASEFPREEHFKRIMDTTASLRELVAAITTKARTLEDDGQFNEAANEWETLRSVHPLYPNLDVEIERVRSRREQQTRRESKDRWLQQAQRFLDLGNYAEALRLVESGLAEFPSDADLLALQRRATDRRNRAAEAERLTAEGHQHVARGEYDAGLDRLWRAFDIDKRNAATRSVLVNALVKRATALQASDPFEARQFVNRALELEPLNPAALTLRSMLEAQCREFAITEVVKKVHSLQEHGDTVEARNVITAALPVYPDEPRLQQLLTSLEEDLPKPADHTRVFVPPPDLPDPDLAEDKRPPAPAVTARPAGDWWKKGALLAGLALAVAGLAFVAASLRTKPDTTIVTTQQAVRLEFRPAVASARVYLDGQPVSGNSVDLKPRDQEYVLEARLPGYKSLPERMKVTAETKSLSPLVLHLDPLATRLVLDTGMRATSRGADISGSAELQAGPHSIELTSEGANLTLTIEADTGRQPLVTVPSVSGVSFYCIVTTLGSDGQLDMSAPLPRQLLLDGKPLEPIAARMPLSGLEPGDHTITMNGGAPLKFTAGPEPFVLIQAVTGSNLGFVSLSVTDDGASVSLTGPTQTKPVVVRDHRAAFQNLKPGEYALEIQKDGFETLSDRLTIRKGANAPDRPYSLVAVKGAPSLLIVGGVPNTEVSVDGRQVGVVNGGGQLEASGLPTGRRMFRLQHHLYEPKSFLKDLSAGERVQLTADELKMTRLLGIQVQNQVAGSRFRIRLKGSPTWEEVANSFLPVRRAGTYEVERQIAGVRRGYKEIEVRDGVVATEVPLTEEPAAPVVRPLDRRMLSNFDPQPRKLDKDGYTDVDNALMAGRVENGVFEFRIPPPRARLFLNKQTPRWSVRSTDGTCFEFELIQDKFAFGKCNTKGKVTIPNRAGKSASYHLRITFATQSVTTEIAGDAGVAYFQQDTRGLTGPIEFRLDAPVKDFRFSGRIAP